MLTVLLGVAVVHVGHSSGVANAYLARAQARSELVSATNFCLKWLSAELKKGAPPRASAVDADEELTHPHALRIFSISDFGDGKAEIYDLGYDGKKLAEPVEDPLSFPPNFFGGYMIRATVVKKGLAPLTMESVYEVHSFDIGAPSGAGPSYSYVLEEKPLYWRELFR